MTSSNWDKFVLLMWKNWLLQWRHKLQLVMQILVPIILIALLALISLVANPKVFGNVTRFKPVQINTLKSLR